MLFTILPATGGLDLAQAAVLDLTTRTYTVVVRGANHARYLPTGHLVYFSAGTLRAVPFDLDTLTVASSPPIPVLSSSGTGAFDVSRNGTLVYTTGQVAETTFNLVWVDRQGHEEIIPATPRTYLYPRLSPDGTRVALDIRDQDNDIWMWDLAGETLTRVTTDPGLERFPLWADNGRTLIFSSDRMGQSNLFRQSATGVGKPERLFDSPIVDVPMSILKDGRRIVVRRDFDLMLMTFPGSGPPVVQPLIQSPMFREVTAAISPDEKWMAYGSNESGPFEIHVTRFPDVNAGRSQVSKGGGTQPLWSRDGRELFFFATSGELMGVRVGPGPTWTASTPTRILGSGYARGNDAAAATYDISLDGKRFLTMKRTESTSAGGQVTIVVVQNWFEELKRTVPVR